ncbi:MAG: hypothetical protein MI861_27160 [Pirellulales bacterium]|nr:hypothetical protein [Pirellulales bacterium]
MNQETILNVFPGQQQDSRLVIALVPSTGGGSHLELRQENRADKVGWFVQSRVSVMPEQVAGLRAALAGNDQGSTRRFGHRQDVQQHGPAVLRFSEVAAQVG